MTRPYAVKAARKLKKRLRVEEEGEEEEKPRVEEEGEEEKNEEIQIEEEVPEERGGGDNDGGAAAEDQLDGIPISRPVLASNKPGVVFLLDRASLEVAKVGKGEAAIQKLTPVLLFEKATNFQILNSDDHANFLKKQKRNPADYRPDIIHQALLAILDSPLTKAGRLQALYVRTEKGVLFEVKPHVRMPRTFKRFCGLMLQLLQKLSITAAGKREKLLNVIKNDIGRYLPVNSRRIGLSHSSEKMVQMRDYVAAASDDVNLVFVVGAMAHGKINNDNTDDFISISNYPLSAACCLGRICNALEQKWKII